MDALWQCDLRIHTRRATTVGDLPPDTDADQLVYELVGIMLALNHSLQLHYDQQAPAGARRAMHRLLEAENERSVDPTSIKIESAAASSTRPAARTSTTRARFDGNDQGSPAQDNGSACRLSRRVGRAQ